MPYKDIEKEKECQRMHQKKYYTNNKEKVKERHKKRNDELRKFCDEIKTNSKCIICGESDPICLDFHHLDPTQKESSLASLTGSGRSLDKIKTEIKKCVVVCSNCHRKITYGKIDITQYI